MSQSNLIRWIEDAEARHVLETSTVERGWTVSENHFLHLGKAIAKVPFWPRQQSRSALLSIGCHALEAMRQPRTRQRA